MPFSHRLPTVVALALLGAACTEQQRDVPIDPVETLVAESPAAALRPSPQPPVDSDREPPVESNPAVSVAPAPVAAGPAAEPQPAAAAPVAVNTEVASTPAPAAAPSPASTSSGNRVSVGQIGSESVVGVVAASTLIPVSTRIDVCTNTHAEGQRFEAFTTEPINGSYGSNIPAGTALVLEIVRMNRSDNVADPVEITLRPRHLDLAEGQRPVDAMVENLQVHAVRKEVGGRAARGGLIGALAGAAGAKLAGKSNEDAAKIAVGTGAAGAGIGAATANAEGCIQAQTPFAVRLMKPVELRAVN